jgi:GT2 family glycosyltransferase
MTADVTVVITTHERPDGCLRALDSVLAQEPAPAAVIVADDGSSAAALERLERRIAAEPAVRLHRLDPPRGGPGPGRNAGIALAQTSWVAFLDDDDVWRPGKLAAQAAHFADPAVDVIGTNALRRSDGRRYFPRLGAPSRPDRRAIVSDNPLIVSSVTARRTALRAIGGFDERRWMGGIADYDAWLRLADAGCGFLVLPEPLITYEDAGGDRYSASRRRMQRALIRHGWARWLRHPGDRGNLCAALWRTAAYALIVAEDARSSR